MAAHLIKSVCLILSLMVLSSVPAWSEPFPDRPIRLIVPYSAGGTVDIIARLVADSLSARLSQPVIVENKAGAGGSIGMASVAKAKKDGYTLGIGTTGPLAINLALHRKPEYDPRTDFAPISLIAATPQTLAVHNSTPVESVSELVAYAKAHPGKLNFASPGIGSSAHLAGELFKSAAKIDIVHIPYKGNREALMDVSSGRVKIIFSPLATIMPLVRSGQLRLLGVASTERSPLVPAVPTITETGLWKVQAEAWFGLVGPAGIPEAVVLRLASEVAKVLDEPYIREEFARHGVERRTSTSGEFEAFINAQLISWAANVREAGLVKN